MSERGDGDFLRDIFLVEAWDTAGALEGGLGHLSHDGDPRAVASLLVLAHRLKGSAALHCFPGPSELAAVAEEELERVPATPVDQRERMRRGLGEVVGLVKDTLDRIAADGAEDAEGIAAWRTRRAAAASPAASDLRAPAHAAW